jgi:hypothetical protein
MRNIKEEVLKLPREEKIDLYNALMEDLGWGDDVMGNDELSPEDWIEIKKREAMIESGEAGFISFDEFKKKINEFKG